MLGPDSGLRAGVAWSLVNKPWQINISCALNAARATTPETPFVRTVVNSFPDWSIKGNSKS